MYQDFLGEKDSNIAIICIKSSIWCHNYSTDHLSAVILKKVYLRDASYISLTTNPMWIYLFTQSMSNVTSFKES